MSSVYVVREGGKSEPMKSVRCKDEDKELQTILKNNFNLLPGEQIEPDAPCRWMLIKREMPVPDAATGTDLYSIDFFFVDQTATPTFVECKRGLDTRGRREVVGQVLEYAANAQYYWSAEYIRSQAELTAQGDQSTADEAFRAIKSDFENSEEFFKEIERRLKAADIRIVFFLENARPELKRLVEFMNAQMTSVEVLIVEAKQYSHSEVRVVVPTLFGFTERIREIKRAASAERNRSPIATDWESFEKNTLLWKLDEQTLDAMRGVYETCKSLQADISWGRGIRIGSFSPKWPFLHASTSPFSICANGRLEFHLDSFHGSNLAESFSATFGRALLDGGLGLTPEFQSKFVSIPAERWVPHAKIFIAALRGALEKEIPQSVLV